MRARVAAAPLPIRLLERTGATGTGLDRDGHAVALARADAAGRIDAAPLSLRAEDFGVRSFDDGSFDVAICVGPFDGVVVLVEVYVESARRSAASPAAVVR